MHAHPCTQGDDGTFTKERDTPEPAGLKLRDKRFKQGIFLARAPMLSDDYSANYSFMSKNETYDRLH